MRVYARAGGAVHEWCGMGDLMDQIAMCIEKTNSSHGTTTAERGQTYMPADLEACLCSLEIWCA